MKPPRLKISIGMAMVAVMALEFAAIKAVMARDESELLYEVFPTANMALLAGGLGIFKPRLRSFVVGFVSCSILSLIAFQAWESSNPWTFLNYLAPPFEVLDRRIAESWPINHVVISYAVLAIVFALPPAFIGLAGGYLTSKLWKFSRRRKLAE